MEYSELVDYYRKKLLERYKEALARPELQTISKKLQTADAETLHEVLQLLTEVR